MSKKFSILQPLTLPNGVGLSDRIGLAPMETISGIDGGKMSQEEMDYFEERNEIGSLIITGATCVSENGFFQLSQPRIDKEENIENFSELAKKMQAKGNKAIVQIHHGGREAGGVAAEYGNAFGPSDGPVDRKFPWHDYETWELSVEQIEQIVQEYKEAARNCLKAGFAGIEIHGANHYLVQQFLSAYSNRRTDKYGGDINKRLTFLIEVLEAVLEMREEENRHDFIIGLKINAEELHGPNYGFDIDDTIYWLQTLKTYPLDFIEISTNMSDCMATSYSRSQKKQIAVNQEIHKALDGRIPHLISGGVKTPTKASELIESGYGDMVLLGRAAVVDPEWLVKVRRDQSDKIIHEVPYEKVEDWGIPSGMLRIFKVKTVPDLPVSNDVNNEWSTRGHIYKK